MVDLTLSSTLTCTYRMSVKSDQMFTYTCTYMHMSMLGVRRVGVTSYVTDDHISPRIVGLGSTWPYVLYVSIRTLLTDGHCDQAVVGRFDCSWSCYAEGVMEPT
jgi:hypothetical protein